MKQHKIKLIGSAIKSLLEQYGLDVRMKQYEVLEIWDAAVGEQIAKATKPEKIDRGVLTVRVEKSVWRNELSYMKKEIIEKLNMLMQEEIVKEIIFR